MIIVEYVLYVSITYPGLVCLIRGHAPEYTQKWFVDLKLISIVNFSSLGIKKQILIFIVDFHDKQY